MDVRAFQQYLGSATPSYLAPMGIVIHAFARFRITLSSLNLIGN